MLGSQQAQRTCQEGDCVILYSGHDRVHSVLLKQGEVFNHKYGCFKHNDIIGKPYGSKISAYVKDRSRNRRVGYVQLLKVTPELWQAGPLVHRTQIIYSLDLSVITSFLELTPGKVVVESGTGSGALSVGIARCISAGGPENPFNGKLHTFEFHPVRAEGAREMFETLQLSHIVNVTHRDVCEEGFTLANEAADAVFLDLPSPWKAIGDAWRVLKKEGRICSFSPCIEQVQRACRTLMETGFHDVRTVEVLRRDVDVFPEQRERRIDLEKLRKRDLLDPSTLAEIDGSSSSSSSSGAGAQKEEIKPLGKRDQREDDEGDVYQRTEWEITEVPAGQLPPLAPNAVHSLFHKPRSAMISHTAYLTFATKSHWGHLGNPAHDAQL
eukprot:TRINITY_DN524_c0_g1_i1.p1 TRINITY_DN524_c0_g1~~TRINITY_DN524_c0_g1_i1.p1  ORF type:complete len:382 (-),score=113.56 TRINITY_DN524_c0_g1_i1:3-1148(-)